MLIVTSNSKKYDVLWADTSMRTGDLLFEMRDERRVPVIAAELDGLEWLKRVDENQGDKLFEGFSRLVSVQTTEDSVLITLKKEDA